MTSAAATNRLESIDQRLDALDRALLGVLPRGERLAMVAGIEEKLRELHDADPNAFDELADQAEIAPAARERSPADGRRQRSRLALASGILGIIALALLFATPIFYVVIASIADMIGEVASYVLLGLNVLIVGGGGGIALVMGIAALLRLSRSRSRKTGYGWAITGLCTAPVPALAGLLVLLSVAIPLAMEVADSDGGSPPVYTASAPPPVSPPIYPSGPVEAYSAAPYLPPPSGASVATPPYGANAPTPWIAPPPLPPTSPSTLPPSPTPSESPTSQPAAPSGSPPNLPAAPSETPPGETPPAGPAPPIDPT